MNAGLQASESLDEILYHYTSFEAFLSIVRHGVVWATERKYLNDATELQYGLGLAAEVSRDHNIKIPDRARQPTYSSSSLSHSYMYIFSLSKKGDLLSQWRAYCSDGGVSIGFSKNALERLAVQQRFELIECVYDKKIQVDNLLEVFEENLNPDDFYRKFLRVIASFKDPAFSEEEEYRLVSDSCIYEQQIYDPKWRATQTMPVQYTEILLSKGLNEFQLRRRYPNLSSEQVENMISPKIKSDDEYLYGLEPFRKIIVGPSTHHELVQQAVAISFLITQCTEKAGGVHVVLLGLAVLKFPIGLSND